MWKSLRLIERASVSLGSAKRCANRTFLSEAYRCTDAWNRRLDSPLLSKINTSELFVEIDQKFQSVGKASAVDVDIFVNILRNADNTDELVDVLHRHRLTPETSNTLDSTHHAVIRFLLDNEQIEDLMTILNDRINYGIFPDPLCYNILMDTFVKKQNFGAAARVAVLLMLQEDSGNPITNALAIYSCHKYLENPDSWIVPIPEPEPDNGEEIKVRVRYIRNPYFDDHFDLTQPSDLVGKTHVFFGKLMNDALGRTCRLRGLVLWKKYADAVELIDEWMRNDQMECVYGEVLPMIQKHLESIPEGAATEDVKELKTRLELLEKSSLKEGSVVEDMENRIRAAVRQQEETDISQQLQIYEDWEKKRIALLEHQLSELDKKTRLEKVETLKKELADRERFVTFFENRAKIDLAIETKLRYEKERYGKRVKTRADVDDNYIPPEITKTRNS